MVHYTECINTGQSPATGQRLGNTTADICHALTLSTYTGLQPLPEHKLPKHVHTLTPRAPPSLYDHVCRDKPNSQSHMDKFTRMLRNYTLQTNNIGTQHRHHTTNPTPLEPNTSCIYHILCTLLMYLLYQCETDYITNRYHEGTKITTATYYFPYSTRLKEKLRDNNTTRTHIVIVIVIDVPEGNTKHQIGDIYTAYPCHKKCTTNKKNV